MPSLESCPVLVGVFSLSAVGRLHFHIVRGLVSISTSHGNSSGAGLGNRSPGSQLHASSYRKGIYSWPRLWNALRVCSIDLTLLALREKVQTSGSTAWTRLWALELRLHLFPLQVDSVGKQISRDSFTHPLALAHTFPVSMWALI